MKKKLNLNQAPMDFGNAPIVCPAHPEQAAPDAPTMTDTEVFDFLEEICAKGFCIELCWGILGNFSPHSKSLRTAKSRHAERHPRYGKVGGQFLEEGHSLNEAVARLRIKLAKEMET